MFEKVRDFKHVDKKNATFLNIKDKIDNSSVVYLKFLKVNTVLGRNCIFPRHIFISLNVMRKLCNIFHPVLKDD